MLCACSGEQFKFEEAPKSPESVESLATRDFSASGLSSRTGDWESKFEENQVDDVESTLKEALSLNYEEARALLGRLEYQKGNLNAALQVFQGISIRSLTPSMTKAIMDRTRQRKGSSKGENFQAGVMSMHSVSLILEAILLKAKSLQGLGFIVEAAKECKIILDTVESALPNGMPEGVVQDCKLQEMFHRALGLLPKLWKKAGYLEEAIVAYRRALTKPWNLNSNELAGIEKDLAAILLHGGVEASIPTNLQLWGLTMPKNNTEEAILLLFILMRKMLFQEIVWDPEIMDQLSFALAVSGQFEYLADHFEQVLPSIYSRADRWYLLALCYSAAGQDEVALNLLKRVLGSSESKHNPHFSSLLLGAKLFSKNPKHATEGIHFAQRAINLKSHQNEHLKGRAHQLLGVCYGSAATVSFSDSQRVYLQCESLKSLNYAAMIEREDPDLMFSLGLENAMQRNLNEASENARLYSEMIGGSCEKGWKLLSLVVSAEQRFKDAETIVDLALNETGRREQLEFLRLKAVIQIAQEQPKHAIETYRILLSMIQAQRKLQTNNSYSEVTSVEILETKAWQDLTNVYTKLGSWSDAEICAEKAKSICIYSPQSWHTAGVLFEAQSLYKEALMAFSTSLSIEPDHAPSMVSIAAILIKLGKESVPIARSFLMSALHLEPTNHEAWLNLGYISKMEGSLQQAAEFFQAAYELNQSAPVQNFM
ncbi:hypothetical protein GIB67_010801 [Kingdonia uniflora]|uniref:Uncharacterized protein n=1 Tax=Kingdonia uniflora TaxID=39325 RepID=A0A7J7L8V6_9MAGN|nr:hypothetical protein GIB67_010801 [Kingdonia uniflora]